MANLTGQQIKDTYQEIVTVGSGNTITDGTGSLIENLEVTASYATNAATATTAVNAITANSATTANSANFATLSTSASFASTTPTGSLIVTGSVNANIVTLTKGDGTSFDLTVATGSAVSASYATFAETANTANTATTAGTASYVAGGNVIGLVAQAISSSYSDYALTASYALNVDPIDTGSLMVTGSVVDNTLTFTKGDGSAFSLTVATGSAVSSSYSAYAVSASHATYSETAGTATSADTATSSSYALNASSADSALSATSASYALNASSADSALTATSASHALYADAAGTAGSATTATSASYASNASTADSALAATSSSYASNASTADSSTSASYAGNAELLDGLDSTAFAQLALNNSFSGTQTFNNINVNGTGSFNYIEAITGSAKIIGDAYIILNNNTPTERFAGVVVQDSGSTLTTASFEFDGQYNDWFYEYSTDGGATTDHGVALFGPEYATKGVPSYPGANKLQKGTGGHHLADSNITDNGTTVAISTPVDVTGAVTASLGFKGDLDGNAATATSATTATTASYAVTASYLEGGVTTPTLQEVTTAGQSTTNYLEVSGSTGKQWMMNTQNIFWDNAGNAVGSVRYESSNNALEIQGSGTTITSLDPGNYGLSIQYYPFQLSGVPTDKSLVWDATASAVKFGIPASATSASYASNASTADSAASATSASHAIIADSALTAASATSASYASYALTASYALNGGGGGGGGEATHETGDILFENIAGEIYGSAATPVSGNITISSTSTKLDGSVAIIYHTDALEPTISGATVDKKVGNYESGSLNIITLTNSDGTNILEYIAGGDLTYVASASYADNAGLVPGTGTDSMESAGFLTTNSAVASGANSIALGDNVLAAGAKSIAIGYDLYTSTDDGTTAIGSAVTASGYTAVAIGTQAKANGYQSLALGSLATADGFAATAFGAYGKAEADLATAFGNGASIRSSYGVGIGASTEAEGGTGCVAIGANARAYGNYSVAIGRQAGTTYNYADQIVIGAGSTTTGTNEILIGSGSVSYGANTVHIGNAATTKTYLEGEVRIDNQVGISNFGDQDSLFIVGPNSATSAGGGYNIALGGRNVLQNITTASGNIAMGSLAGQVMTSGLSNILIGSAAGQNLVADNYNVAVGQSALGKAGYTTTADGNVAIGFLAGSEYYTGTSGFLTTVSNSVYLGRYTRAGANGVTNETVVGYNAIGNGSNTVTIGNSSVTGAYVQVAWTVVSDERDKTNFSEVPHGLDFVKGLKPTAYQFKDAREAYQDEEGNTIQPQAHGPVRYGFKAQDILALEGDNSVIVNSNNPEKLMYTEANLIPVLVKAIQELEAKVAALEAK